MKDKKRTDIILDSIADGVFTVDKNWRITSFNAAAEKITRIPRKEAIGQRCCDVFRASICESDCALRKTMETGQPIINESVFIINAAGERVPISISTALLREGDSRIIGGVETFRDLSMLEELRRALEKKYSFQDIISKNDRMLRLFENLPVIAESDSTVLIEGESGTGKELVARAIHNLSARHKRQIIPVNCGALPDNLLESELFGYKAGAFTDARKDKPGRFARAEGGTLFLDEISDISPALQIRLLRAIQERSYEPLGGTETVNADVRIIAATNKDLLGMVGSGKFREDLYYRINVIKIVLPPLRERKEDIPLLIDHFINHFNAIKNNSIKGISATALTGLMNHDFPGNVRELENIIEHAFVLCRRPVIEAADLPDYLRPRAGKAVIGQPVSLDELEAAYITGVLEKNSWNRTAAAAELGMHKTTLWRKMKKMGIRQPK